MVTSTAYVAPPTLLRTFVRFPNPLDVAYAAIAFLGSPIFAYRLVRTGKWRTDWRGRLGHTARLGVDELPTVLVHGVSVGEVAAAAPLVTELSRGDSDEVGTRVVVSATTNTGVARAEALYGSAHDVVRYPLDFSSAVDRFLDSVRPDVVALMELEVWPNFTKACAERGIPVVVVNGRLSASSFRGYRRLRPLVRPSFRRLAGVAAQTEAYAERFRFLGVPDDRIVVADSLKWEVRLPEDLHASADRLASEMGVDRDRPLVVGVSTGPGEERMLLDSRPDGVQLMVVPRKPERFEEVAAIAPWVRRSSGRAGSGDLFLVDTMGEAEAATALATVVAVGRSWNGLGGSNPIPAALLGRPALVGPDHANFQEMVDVLARADAVRVAPDARSGLRALLSDRGALERMGRAGPGTVAAHRGATIRNAAVIRAALSTAGALRGSEEQRLRS